MAAERSRSRSPPPPPPPPQPPQCRCRCREEWCGCGVGGQQRRRCCLRAGHDQPPGHTCADALEYARVSHGGLPYYFNMALRGSGSGTTSACDPCPCGSPACPHRGPRGSARALPLRAGTEVRRQQSCGCYRDPGQPSTSTLDLEDDDEALRTVDQGRRAADSEQDDQTRPIDLEATESEAELSEAELSEAMESEAELSEAMESIEAFLVTVSELLEPFKAMLVLARSWIDTLGDNKSTVELLRTVIEWTTKATIEQHMLEWTVLDPEHTDFGTLRRDVEERFNSLRQEYHDLALVMSRMTGGEGEAPAGASSSGSQG